MVKILDSCRWTLIVLLWVGVAVWLWGFAWYWTAVWLIPGLIICLNLVGFAMVPLYLAANGRAAERRLIEGLLKARERTEGQGGAPR